MCGIIGYTGRRAVVPILLEGLSRLEYRGYDSAGIVVYEGDELKLVKKAGRISVLKELLEHIDTNASLGIGHTRWATHGAPSDVNAHPHTDDSGCFAVVHNGIIENYMEIKEWLLKKGHKFVSDTDTEVLPHLIKYYYDGDLLAAVKRAKKQIEGSYAMVVLSKHEPKRLVAARQDSPLILGVGEGEYFVASDIPAILKYTRSAVIIDDGETVDITDVYFKVYNGAELVVKKQLFNITWEDSRAEKAGYDHFMLKEIHEQPNAIKDTVRGRITDNRVVLKELEGLEDFIKGLRRIHIVACGTAYHAGMVGKYAIELLARIPVEVDIASEFRYRNPIVSKGDLVIVISQSGETADTLAALRESKRLGAKVLAATNVVGSSVSREVDYVIYTWAGPEIAVASTKAFTTQLAVMYMIAVWLSQKLDTITEEHRAEILRELKSMPEKAAKALRAADDIKKIAKAYVDKNSVFFIGRGQDNVIASEGALKLKEISYIHAEAYAAGELKHGTLALIEEGVPVVALVAQRDLAQKMYSNIKEVKARGAKVLAVALEGDEIVEKEADEVIYIPDTHSVLSSILTVIPLQLLAYYVSVLKGCDVDKPRNLAKSVTVE
ncbi:glutamine--fructose-6-phosphate transaminase (isomerizing) [Peptococcaceae bacterium]|nr:glutamine--fructose-6-phosphate transaminase (isomerizing) [Peptococcaceae bacterium]